MESRRLTFFVFAAVAAGVGAWALYALGPASRDSVPPGTSQTPLASRGGLTGPAGIGIPASAPVPAPAVAPAATADRFKLAGLVAAKGSEGLALISVNGAPARTFRVGEVVEGDIVLREVTERGAVLGPRDGGAAIAVNASAAPAPPTATAARPAMETGLGSSDLLRDSSARSQHHMGSKYPPLPPRADSAPQGTAGEAAPVPDDGRWTPPSEQ